MFHKASLIATVTLALIAAATPMEGTEGIRVPLARRARLTKADGTFDLARAIEHTVTVKNKHRQNLINLERNMGKEAFNDASQLLVKIDPS